MTINYIKHDHDDRAKALHSFLVNDGFTMEEMEHMNNWAELRMEEEAIKSAIKELRDLNKEQDDLNTMRNNLA